MKCPWHELFARTNLRLRDAAFASNSKRGKQVKSQSKSRTTSFVERRATMKALPMCNSPRRGAAHMKLYRSREDKGKSAASWNRHLRGPLIVTQRKLLFRNFGHSGPAKCCDTKRTVNTAEQLGYGAYRDALSDGRSLNPSLIRTSRGRLSKVANRSVSSQRSRGLTSRSFLPYRVSRRAFYVSFQRESFKYNWSLRSFRLT